MHLSVLSSTVRSLYFRRRLASAIPALEQAIRQELDSREARTALVGGFRVRVSEAGLSIDPASTVHPGQLPLLAVHSDRQEERLASVQVPHERR